MSQIKTKKFTNFDVLIRPYLWCRLYPYRENIDTIVNSLIDEAEKDISIIKLSKHRIKINKFEIWIANRFYGYGGIFFIEEQGYYNKEQLCSRKTALRLENLIEQYLLNKTKE